MAEIILLDTPKRRANSSVVKMLKDALKEAKDGKITQAVLVIDAPADGASWRCSDILDINVLLGIMSRAHAGLVRDGEAELEDVPTG